MQNVLSAFGLTRRKKLLPRDYFASQKNAKHPLVSLLNVHPPVQSSARGAVSSGHVSPALVRRSKLTLFICMRTTTKRIRARVRNRIKFHEERSKNVLRMRADDFFFIEVLLAITI